VRNLERQLANLQRKAVREIVADGVVRVKVTSRNLRKYAGVRQHRYGEAESEDIVGVTTGLAWTEVGGELLSIEAVVLPGRGKMTITGKLGDVMQESVQAAKSYLRSRAPELGLKPTIFDRLDIHVHVPEGATPKDGPSAGIAMFTSILSALTGIPVKCAVAMTGEITLRGRVLPIGGLKEKLLAAHRGGIKTVLIPQENEKDLAEIPDNVKRGINIIPVATVDEVLEHTLVEAPTPIEWTEDDDAEAEKVRKPTDDDVGDVITH
jgi:ATP-dependent Lon protease